MPFQTLLIACSLAFVLMPEPYQHEYCDDPVMRLPAATEAMEPLPKWMLSTGGVEIVQVNLNADGLNILGDAANEPSIAIDPTAPNRMAIGWRQFDTVESDFRQAGYSWSVDGGRTWAPLDRIEPGVFRSDPVLGSGPDGVFHYLSLEVPSFNVYDHRSMNGGQTWSEGVYAYGDDKEWLTVHPDGHLFHNWTSSANRSLDGGDTWSFPVSMYADSGYSASEPIWGNAAFGPDGAYYIVGRSSLGYSPIVLVRSDDPLAPTLAFDFGATVELGGELIYAGGPNPAGLAGMPQVAVNRSGGIYNGEVYVLGTVHPSFTTDPGNLRFNRSNDRGETWLDQPITVNDPAASGAWQWFGTMSIAPNGRLDVVWLDTRNAPDPVDRPYISQLYYSFSFDGGRTWSPDLALSAGFNSFRGFPVQRKMGDYFHMVSDNVGADLAWCATFEDEQNVYFTRIGPRDCNGNGVADFDDLAAGTLGDCDGDGVPDECEIAAGVEVPCFGCVPDFAEPFGTLDLADVVAFIVAFVDSEARADLAEPFGVFDLADIAAFVQAFGAGCP